MNLKKYKLSKANRFFFFISSMVIWGGIYLTGCKNIHWLLYIPATFFLGATITGLCFGQIFSSLIFPEKKNTCCY